MFRSSRRWVPGPGPRLRLRGAAGAGQERPAARQAPASVTSGWGKTGVTTAAGVVCFFFFYFLFSSRVFFFLCVCGPFSLLLRGSFASSFVGGGWVGLLLRVSLSFHFFGWGAVF